MYASTPAAASASRSAAASPPGKVGGSQPCGSPRKNWTMSASVACTTANGSPSRSCAPMRSMNPSLATIRWPAGATLPFRLGEGTAVGEGQHAPDEGGDQTGDDDYPLLAGRGDHLAVEADHERGQPDPGRDGVPGDDEAEREGNYPGDQSKDGEGVHHRVLLAVGIQREMRTCANPSDLRHRPPPLRVPSTGQWECAHRGRAGIIRQIVSGVLVS